MASVELGNAEREGVGGAEKVAVKVEPAAAGRPCSKSALRSLRTAYAKAPPSRERLVEFSPTADKTCTSSEPGLWRGAPCERVTLGSPSLREKNAPLRSGSKRRSLRGPRGGAKIAQRLIKCEAAGRF